MSKHTPEPWHISIGVFQQSVRHAAAVASPMGFPVANCAFMGVNPQDSQLECESNAARIVLCVNALSGIAHAEPGSIKRLVEAAKIIDTMPVDGCSPMVVESMLRQAKSLVYAALQSIRVEGGA